MRVITVTGKRGTLVREFKHINLDITKTEEGNVKVDLWFGKRKQLACIRTICSHIENMCTGVMKGYTYKMRFVYSHLPINVSLSGKNVEIRNYLGAKLVRRVKLCDLRRCRARVHQMQLAKTGLLSCAIKVTPPRLARKDHPR